MKTRLFLCILLILTISYSSLNAADINMVHGDVFLIRDTNLVRIKDTGPIDLKPKDSLYASDTGMAILYLPQFKMHIFIDTRTRITFSVFSNNPRKQILFYMKFGNVRFKIGKVIFGRDFLLRTYYSDFFPRSNDFHIYSDIIGTRVSVFQGTGIFGLVGSETICNITTGKYAMVIKNKLIYPRKITLRQRRYFRRFIKQFQNIK